MQDHKYALAKGTKLQGKYTIKSVLGHGGFGITYLAIHDSLGKLVAIKELFLSTQSIFCSRNETDNRTVKPHFANFEVWKSRFLDEAKTLVRFSGKKGIVQIADMFEENNTCYFVMDYIEGTSLGSLVRKKNRLTEQEASNYMLQVLEALDHVHAEGILHRDLKPDNLIVRHTDNQIILIDFGIAREYVENETVTHTAMLSVGYAPPEQKDTRAKRTSSVDLYSVGAVLYFCLTGQRPQTTDEIAMDDYVSAQSLNPAISSAMNSLIDKAIAKKPANRFQTCQEMIAALQNLHSNKKPTDPKNISKAV
ncbi:MAG: serine/threonine protein kinase, partial [Thermoflexibacteraceae bacterium]